MGHFSSNDRVAILGKDLQDFKDRWIASTDYPNLFAVSRFSQTDETQISKTKFQRENLSKLMQDIKNSEIEIDYKNRIMSSNVRTAQQNYNCKIVHDIIQQIERQELMIKAAMRTKLANEIAWRSKQSDIKYDLERSQYKCKADEEIEILNNNVIQLKKSKILHLANIDRFTSVLKKIESNIRRSGIEFEVKLDLTQLYNQNPLILKLEQCQKTQNQQLAQIKVLEDRLENLLLKSKETLVKKRATALPEIVEATVKTQQLKPPSQRARSKSTANHPSQNPPGKKRRESRKSYSHNKFRSIGKPQERKETLSMVVERYAGIMAKEEARSIELEEQHKSQYEFLKSEIHKQNQKNQNILNIGYLKLVEEMFTECKKKTIGIQCSI